MSQNDDIMLRTGGRFLSDIPASYPEDELGHLTVNVLAPWAKAMRRHHPVLFANEAVMALIEHCCLESEDIK